MDDACTAEELAFADRDLAVCAELPDDTWDETILDEFCASSSKSFHVEDVSNDGLEEESIESVAPPPVLKSYSEAMQALENVSHFLEYQGHTSEATEVITLVSTLTKLRYSNVSTRSRQATLNEFFPGDQAV